MSTPALEIALLELFTLLIREVSRLARLLEILDIKRAVPGLPAVFVTVHDYNYFTCNWYHGGFYFWSLGMRLATQVHLVCSNCSHAASAFLPASIIIIREARMGFIILKWELKVGEV